MFQVTGHRVSYVFRPFGSSVPARAGAAEQLLISSARQSPVVSAHAASVERYGTYGVDTVHARPSRWPARASPPVQATYTDVTGAAVEDVGGDE